MNLIINKSLLRFDSINADHTGVLTLLDNLVEVTGVEPTTSCVQGRRSPN